MPTLAPVKRFPGLLYGIVIGLLLGAICYVGTFDSSTFQSYFLLVQLIALGIGLLHVWLGPRFLPQLLGSLSYALLVSVLILLVGMGVALVLFSQQGLPADRWPFITSLLPFLIPVLLTMAYRYYRLIPPASYRKWYYPINGDMPDLDLLDLSQILVIQFELQKTASDAIRTNFKAKAPVSMTLGDLFLVFINDYNERTPASPIQFTDEAGRPFGWVFTQPTSWWKRPVYFDPALNFDQNRLADNATIIAIRAE